MIENRRLKYSLSIFSNSPIIVIQIYNNLYPIRICTDHVRIYINTMIIVLKRSLPLIYTFNHLHQ